MISSLELTKIEDLRAIADNYQLIVNLYSYSLFAKAITKIIDQQQVEINSTISDMKVQIEKEVIALHKSTQSVVGECFTECLDKFQDKIIDELENVFIEAIEKNFQE
jgi:hypothetical protein